jgi:hypothetical protein
VEYLEGQRSRLHEVYYTTITIQPLLLLPLSYYCFSNILYSLLLPSSYHSYYRLGRLGFYKSKSKKGVYVDRHKKEDVIRYRQEVFLPKVKELLGYIIQYDKKNDGT